MHLSNRLVRAAFPLALGFFLTGCGSRDVKVATPATFSSIESVTIATKCLQCHQSLATYSGVLQVVTPGDPAKSKLYQQISSGSMPLQSPQLSDAEITAIYNWILSGAPNG